jgi:hypothetical protein
MRRLTGMATRWIVLAAFTLTACHKAVSPTSPTVPTDTAPVVNSSEGCASSAYIVSGVISASASGPLPATTVQLVPYPFGFGWMARTDEDGHYSICAPSVGPFGLQVFRRGFTTAFKYRITAPEVVSLALRPEFRVPVRGGAISGEISGDEFEAGDDYFGGLCKNVPCKIVTFSYDDCPCSSRVTEITLRSLDPSARLALYFSNTDIYFPPATVPPGTRYCCDSPVTAVYKFNADFDRFAVGFEEIGGRQPGPADRASVEIAVRSLP